MAHSPVHQFGLLSMQNLKAGPEELFMKLEMIDQRLFGEVFQGMDNQTQKVVTMKIIDPEEAADRTEAIRQEIALLSQCVSP